MGRILKKIVFILFSIYSLFFFLSSLLAPVLAYFQYYDLSAKLTSVFVYSCHQRPDRVFWILGYPSALCARCFGFYLGVALSCIFACFKEIKTRKISIIILFLFVFIDLFLNVVIGFDTHNCTRFLIGIFMGRLFVLTLNFVLNFKKEWSMKI